ncbi:MAG TPA: SH3 domain-containing protein [Thermomicrobiales bacterium]|nr:SH3 domain-containing protein [Thermomicrobiales bacterium]
MLHTGLKARGLSWHSPRVNGAFGWRVAVAIVFVFSILFSSQGVAQASSDAWVSTDALYLRSDPNTNGIILNEMVYGDYVAVLDGPTDGGWYYIDYNGAQGWAYGKYLSIGEYPSGYASVAIGGYSSTVWVASDALNVRADADGNATVLGTLYLGDQADVIGDAIGGYYPINYVGIVGWIAGEYISWSPTSSGSEHWISVDRSSSTISLMVGDTATATYVASMGMDNSADGYYATALGTYYVFVKNADLTYTTFAKGYITYWVGFDPDRANGFHSWLLDRNGYFLDGGDGLTGGCVALEPTLAEAVFNFATVGMRVEVHW